MPQLPSSQSRLRRIFRWTLLALIVVGGIWTGVILWWQSGQRQVSPQEVVLYLLVLPITIVAGIAAFQWYRCRHAASLPAPARTSSNGGSHNATPIADNGSLALPILAAWCITSAGSNLDDFRQALLEKKLRPLPDPCLLGEDGYPLFAARIRDLDAGLQEPLDDIPYSAAFSRTLGMLSRLMEQVEVDWPLAAPALEATAPGTGMATLRGSDPAAISPEPRLRLQIKLVTPAEFTPDEQRQALDWLNQTVTTLPVAAEDRHVEAIPARDDATPLLLAERFRNEAGSPGALLILAADSGLCPSTTERLEAEQRLFHSHRPHGLMPGEAAFAILCISQQALRFALQQPTCILQRVATCRRAASADDGGKPSHTSLGAATGAALEAANLTGEAISAIACDADHRSSRVLECIGAMLQHTPQLDAIADRLAVNETCGHTGAASSAGGWVAGIAQAQSTGQPVLVFNVSHAFERAAAVLLPANDYALPA